MRTTSKVLGLVGLVVGCGSTPLVHPDSGVPGVYAYFYANPVDGGAIFAVPAGGGAPVRLAAGDNDHNLGSGFAFDADSVYYSDEHWSAGVGSGLVGTVLALPRTGGSPRSIADGLDQVSAIALDDDAVYFVDVQQTGNGSQTFIGRVPKAGGQVQHVVDLPSVGVAALAVAGGYVYWTQSDRQVVRVLALGGSPEPLSAGAAAPLAIAVDASGVYWLDIGHVGVDCPANDGQVSRFVPGQPEATPLASNLKGADALAVSAGAVFWTTSGFGCNVSTLPGGGAVFELAPGASDPVMLATGIIGPANLFVDGSTLYLTTITDVETNTLAPRAISF